MDEPFPVNLLTPVIFIFFVINIFYLFSYTTSQHKTKNKTKQQTYTQYPKSPVKREGEREGQGNTKQVIPLYDHVC